MASSMAESHQDKEEDKESVKSTATKQPPANCKIHSSYPLDLYCETCEKLVCSYCVLNHCMTTGHKYGFINDMIEKHESSLKKELEPVRKLHQEMIDAVESISSSETIMQSMKEATLQKIQKTFETFIQVLIQKQCHLTESVNNCFARLSSSNSAKHNEVSEMLNKLESVILSVDGGGSNSEPKAVILSGVAETRRNIQECITAATSLSSHPAQSKEMAINLCSLEEFQEFTHSKNFVYTDTDPLKCHIESSYFHGSVEVNKSSEITLALDAQSLKIKALGKLNITAQLLCCHDGSLQSICARKLTNEKYSLSFVPKERGKHELLIKYNDAYISGSPIPIFVTIPPHKLERISVEELDNVAGIQFHGGKLYASQIEREVKVLDPSTLRVERSISVPGLGVFCIGDDYIYVCDMIQHRIIKMDMNGTVVTSTGTQGDGPGQINFPNGIQLSKEKELYVSDSNNHRIQVFDSDLNFVRILGRKGATNGCFNRPAGLDFDDEGNVYVVDEKNCRVQVLTPQGQHVRSIGSDFADPISAAVHRGMLYVTDWDNHRVSVFKTSGEFVSTFGEGCLSRPERIAIDDDGFVYVSDNRSTISKF